MSLTDGACYQGNRRMTDGTCYQVNRRMWQHAVRWSGGLSPPGQVTYDLLMSLPLPLIRSCMTY